jgi:hypothetical protein
MDPVPESGHRIRAEKRCPLAVTIAAAMSTLFAKRILKRIDPK